MFAYGIIMDAQECENLYYSMGTQQALALQRQGDPMGNAWFRCARRLGFPAQGVDDVDAMEEIEEIDAGPPPRLLPQPLAPLPAPAAGIHDPFAILDQVFVSPYIRAREKWIRSISALRHSYQFPSMVAGRDSLLAAQQAGMDLPQQDVNQLRQDVQQDLLLLRHMAIADPLIAGMRERGIPILGQGTFHIYDKTGQQALNENVVNTEAEAAAGQAGGGRRKKHKKTLSKKNKRKSSRKHKKKVGKKTHRRRRAARRR
jgi:hypothetical protein